MVLPGPARLSARTLTWLLRAERIGEPHPVLTPPAVWYPPAELDDQHTRARSEIAALGWYDHHDLLDREVAAALPLLCRAEAEYFGWLTRDGTTIGVLAAGTGRHGLLAVADGAVVTLDHAGRARLAEALVGQIPDRPPGPGKPLSVTRSEVLGTTRIIEAVHPANLPARRARQLIALPTRASGELYAAHRDHLGRYRVSDPLRYADTDAGRYLNLATGADRILITPAARADLLSRLKALETR